MRRSGRVLQGIGIFLSIACGPSAPATHSPALPSASAEAPQAASAAPPPLAAPPPAPAAGVPLGEDTPSTTAGGATFIAPAGWSLHTRGAATIVASPEADSTLVLVDVADAADAAGAVSAAWAAYRPDMKWPLKVVMPVADRDGWTQRLSHVYQTSPNERRTVIALAQRSGASWTVVIEDMTQATREKRGSQVRLIYSRLLPKGYRRESFAGKPAHPLDARRIAELEAFIERARALVQIPGIAIGVVQNGKRLFAGGFGVRELGKAAKVDADTLFMIASNTKAMTTLLLATLVDEQKLDWDTPVAKLWPEFKLGDLDTTSRVLVKHLICACTGMPRQDTEWWFEFDKATPASSMQLLGTMQPTSKFGELFQYSNLMAGAAGYLGAHLIEPTAELGAGYDRAMAQRVFKPLGMTSTTFDYARALRGNHATAHSLDIDDRSAIAVMAANYSVIPLRPAGGAWSNVNDVLSYVEMELARGVLPNGQRYIGESALLARRAPQVSIGMDVTYGMGLTIDTTWGVPVINHGGDMVGYHSDMLWLPEHDVGAVILTNAAPGWIVRGPFQRKLLELLFDGEPLADSQLAAAANAAHARIRAERERLHVPVREVDAAQLASGYTNPALGTIRIRRDRGITRLDIGEWTSELASRDNPDGTLSFITTSPGVDGTEFVAGRVGDQRVLITRDAQHEYVFTER